MQAYSNAYASQSQTYGRVGNTSFSATTYNPALANALNQQTADEVGASFQNINATLNNVLGSLNGSILQTTTVQPGRAFGGEMIVDRPKPVSGSAVPQKITVKVQFAGEEHDFSFDLSAVSH
jgi:hypothetical protein